MAVVVETVDPAGSTRQLADLLVLPARDDRVVLPGATIVFEAGNREAITGIILNGPGRPDTSVYGLTMRFRS